MDIRKDQVQAGKAVVANIRTDTKLIDWAIEHGIYLKIDRSTVYGNPYKIGTHGDRAEVCHKYGLYVLGNDNLTVNLMGLRQQVQSSGTGIVLGCWCYPKECHGNLIAMVINT